MFHILKRDIRQLFHSPISIEYIGISSNLRLFFYYNFIFILVLIFLSVLVGILKHYFAGHHQIILPVNVTFLKVAIIAPVIEEIIFRLIIKVNRLNVVLFFAYLTFYILYQNYILSTFLYYVLVASFFSLLFINAFNHKINENSLKNKHSKFLIYISCLLFGLFHLPNFNEVDVTNIITLGYLFSKVFAGFAFILLRLKFGLSASILLHVIINSIACIMIFNC
ncbi:CPBP family glutamic-type intramembrane protease [Flavobacterium fluviale]|uniref:CAAX prenyl protease 2/Lysostaphin resistance protein A-like domain-containing protein n=1 Tax=Flavobacterium fluviale TaxID=2249356 RepID=A0A344LQC3_9FLAO|nr:hypothetical protein HYN86_05680 [Flavobacterium fluviale]